MSVLVSKIQLEEMFSFNKKCKRCKEIKLLQIELRQKAAPNVDQSIICFHEHN